MALDAEELLLVGLRGGRVFEQTDGAGVDLGVLVGVFRGLEFHDC